MAVAATVMATKVSCTEEGGGNGGTSNGSKGCGQATAMVTMWAMVTATRQVGDKEGKGEGGKGNGNGDEGGGVVSLSAPREHADSNRRRVTV